MRSFCLLAAAVALCALFSCPLPAARAARSFPTAGEAASVAGVSSALSKPSPDAPLPALPKPEIITDDKAGSVRILVAGKEIFRVDAYGIHVTGDIDYTGKLTDDSGAKGP